MLKNTLVLLILLLPFSVFASQTSKPAPLPAPQFVPIKAKENKACSVTSENFCTCFKNKVNRECRKHSNRFVCSSMTLIHWGMRQRYGSIKKACDVNTKTKVARRACELNWVCYQANRRTKQCPYPCS